MSNRTPPRGTGFSLTASLLALSFASLSSPALAQTPPPADPQESLEADATQAEDDGSNDVVVTGSRIRRPDFDTPNPVLSIGAARIQQSGSTNLTDFLTGYPALQGSSTSADNSGDGAGIGATGLNLLDLRNLGTERTLVLVDGRRHVAALPGSQAIDINTIPNDLVERVEILTGGASAIYGADGVTGVVNFITKKNFEGISAHAQAGISEYGDGGKRFLSVTAGKNLLKAAAISRSPMNMARRTGSKPETGSAFPAPTGSPSISIRTIPRIRAAIPGLRTTAFPTIFRSITFVISIPADRAASTSILTVFPIISLVPVAV